MEITYINLFRHLETEVARVLNSSRISPSISSNRSGLQNQCRNRWAHSGGGVLCSPDFKPGRELKMGLYCTWNHVHREPPSGNGHHRLLS